MFYNVDDSKCFNPAITDATVNIVSFGFQQKYCKNLIEKYRYTKNYISTKKTFSDLYNRLINRIKINIPELIKLRQELENCKNLKVSIVLRLITALAQIIPMRAVSEEILDPIIIEAKDPSFDKVYQIVEQYSDCPFRPIIIILLDKTVSEQEMRQLLNKFPLNIKVALHHDSGQTEIVSVVKNDGTNSFREFIDAYSAQCFYACGNTKQDLLLKGIEQTDTISKINAFLIKCHSSLLIDNKTCAAKDISEIDSLLTDQKLRPDLKMFFSCLNCLNTVYAKDVGGNDIRAALTYSKELDSDILSAFVKKYAHFFPDVNNDNKIKILESARDTFADYSMVDHKLYCQNNALTYSFYTPWTDCSQFNDMIGEAVDKVPGLAGLSILYLNAGTAALYNRNPKEALNKFKTGMDNAQMHSRPAQRIGLIGNITIAESLLYQTHQTQYFINTANDIINMPNARNLTFIQINGLLNLIAAARYENNTEAIKAIMGNANFSRILKDALLPGKLGLGSLLSQLKKLSELGLDFSDYLIDVRLPAISVSGNLRYDYVSEHGFNPAINNAWL